MLSFFLTSLIAPLAVAASTEIFFDRAGVKISLGSSYAGNVCGGGVPIDGGRATVYCRAEGSARDFRVAGIYACKAGKKEGVATLTPCGGLRAEENYQRGQLHGLRQLFYPNGKIAQEESYRSGKKHGGQKKFREDGVVTEASGYFAGELHGRVFQLAPLKVRYFKRGKDQGPSDYFTVNKQEQLILAAASGNLSEIDQLLAQGARPGSIGETAFTPETPLHAAADFGQLAALKKLVAHQPSAINAFDKLKVFTPLHRAIMHPPAVEFLLSQGATPNLAGPSGSTALHEAARHGQLETVKILLAYKASALLLDSNGDSPARLVKPGADANFLRELLRGEKTAGKEKEDDLNRVASLTKALAAAASKGDLAAVQTLVREGAPPRLAGAISPLLLASQAGSLPVVAFLLGEGVAVDEAGPSGQTALMAAAEIGNLELARLLLERGAKRELKDKKGKMAVDYAREKKMKAVTDLLTDYR